MWKLICPWIIHRGGTAAKISECLLQVLCSSLVVPLWIKSISQGNTSCFLEKQIIVFACFFPMRLDPFWYEHTNYAAEMILRWQKQNPARSYSYSDVKCWNRYMGRDAFHSIARLFSVCIPLLHTQLQKTWLCSWVRGQEVLCLRSAGGVCHGRVWRLTSCFAHRWLLAHKFPVFMTRFLMHRELDESYRSSDGLSGWKLYF